MTRYSVRFSVVLASLLLLADAGASQAGLFGRWRGNAYQSNYYYQPYAPATSPAATQGAPATSPATSPATATPAKPLVYSASMPVVSPVAAVPATVVQPSAVYAAPTGAATGSSWSVAPRSSWDFGSYPPYSR